MDARCLFWVVVQGRPMLLCIKLNLGNLLPKDQMHVLSRAVKRKNFYPHRREEQVSMFCQMTRYRKGKYGKSEAWQCPKRMREKRVDIAVERGGQQGASRAK